MIRVRFTPEDRERYSLPEWINFDPLRPKLSEIRRVKAEVGWEWSQVADGVDGDDADQKAAARAVMWWLLVNRHHPVSWDDFDLDLFGVDWEQVEDPNPPAPDGASTG